MTQTTPRTSEASPRPNSDRPDHETVIDVQTVRAAHTYTPLSATAAKAYEHALRQRLADPATCALLAEDARLQTARTLTTVSAMEPAINTLAATVPGGSLSAVATATAVFIAGMSLAEHAVHSFISSVRALPFSRRAARRHSAERLQPEPSSKPATSDVDSDPQREQLLNRLLTEPVYATATRMDAHAGSGAFDSTCVAAARTLVAAVTDELHAANEAARDAGLPSMNRHLSGGVPDGRVAGRRIDYVADVLAGGEDVSARTLAIIAANAAEIATASRSRQTVTIEVVTEVTGRAPETATSRTPSATGALLA